MDCLSELLDAAGMNIDYNEFVRQMAPELDEHEEQYKVRLRVCARASVSYFQDMQPSTPLLAHLLVDTYTSKLQSIVRDLVARNQRHICTVIVQPKFTSMTMKKLTDMDSSKWQDVTAEELLEILRQKVASPMRMSYIILACACVCFSHACAYPDE
jgi:hypothetical protein